MKRFISLLNIVLVLSLLVAGCAPAPTPQVIEKEVVVEKPVEVTKIVEVIKEVPVEEKIKTLEWLASEMLKDDSFARELAACPRAVFEEYGLSDIKISGPSSGSLPHEPEDGEIEGYKAGVSVVDFVAEATFHNPYASTEGDWDYGFLCRYLSYETFYLIRVESDGDWEHWGLINGDWTKVEDGYVSSLRTGADQINHLCIIVIGDSGKFYVNGQFVASLDMSGLTEAGDIWAATETARGSGIEGKVTRFEDFTVWSLD